MVYKEQLGQAYGIRTPALYFAAFEQDMQEIVLLMEDMAPLSVPNQRLGVKPGDGRVQMSVIAKLHSGTFNKPDLWDWSVFFLARLLGLILCLCACV